jgi:hypothetical protein
MARLQQQIFQVDEETPALIIGYLRCRPVRASAHRCTRCACGPDHAYIAPVDVSRRVRSIWMGLHHAAPHPARSRWAGVRGGAELVLGDSKRKYTVVLITPPPETSHLHCCF